MLQARFPLQEQSLSLPPPPPPPPPPSLERTFRHIFMICTLLLTLTGLRQRLPDLLPELPRDQRDLRRV